MNSHRISLSYKVGVGGGEYILVRRQNCVVVNPRRACAARVTVVVLCVCVCVSAALICN